MKRQRGFTLIEIMIVVMITGILLGVGLPGMRDFIRNNNRASSVNDFLSTLHIARSEAVTRNARILICSSSDGASCDAGEEWNLGWIAFVDADGNFALGGDELILDVHGEVENMKVYSGTFDSYVIYRPNGRAMHADTATSTGEFMLCDPRGADDSRVIIIGTSGRPRSSQETAAGNSPDC